MIATGTIDLFHNFSSSSSVLNSQMKKTTKLPGRKLSKKLENFQYTLIEDSTVVRLHYPLGDKFTVARSRTIAACVKVGVIVSAVANGPKTIALYSEKTAEIKTLKIGH